MEAGQPEDSAKARDVVDAGAECSCGIRGSGGGSRGRRAAAAGGDRVDNRPYEVADDETSLVTVGDMAFVIGKPSGRGRGHDVPGVLLVPPAVKSEPAGDNGVEAAEEASYDHCPETMALAHEKRIFDEDDDEDVVVV